MRDAFRRARDRTGIYGVNPLSAAAAEAAWRGGGPWLDEVLVYLSESARILRTFFSDRPELNVRAVPIDGPYLAWLDFRRTGIAVRDLETFLLEEAGLRLEDGAIFGAEGRGSARMNLACPRPLLQGRWSASNSRSEPTPQSDGTSSRTVPRGNSSRRWGPRPRWGPRRR